MTRIQALLLDLRQALSRLREAGRLAPTVIHQDATIQRFEFTFELSWKLMQAILKDNDIETYGVRNVFREAARLELINDPKVWFLFLEMRNLTVHTYKEEVARKVYKSAKDFIDHAQSLLDKAEEYIKKRNEK